VEKGTTLGVRSRKREEGFFIGCATFSTRGLPRHNKGQKRDFYSYWIDRGGLRRAIWGKNKLGISIGDKKNLCHWLNPSNIVQVLAYRHLEASMSFLGVEKG